MLQIVIFGNMFWVAVSHLMCGSIDSQISRLIVEYRKTLQDIIQRKYQNLLVFIESYSGDHRQIQKGFKLGINEEIFLIS